METILVLFLLAGIWYLGQLAIYLCAKLDILWVMPKEGEAIAIMRNESFYKMILRYTGHHFRGHLKDENDNVDNLEIYNIEVSPNTTAFSSANSHFLSIIFPVRGISWVGIPPFYKIYKYTFGWTDDRFVERKLEDLKWILVQKYVYGIVLDKIELEGGIPYTIRLLVTIQVTNPAKALFRIKRWLDTSIERISGWARDEFSGLTLEDFVVPTSDKPKVPNDIRTVEKLDEALKRIFQFAENNLTPQIGVSVSMIQIANIDPSDEKLREVTIKKEVAKQTALAVIEEAKGEAEAIRIVSEATEKMSDKALVLKGFDAIKHAGANVTLIGKDLNLPAMINVPITKKGGSE